jgi:hypothetical protein
LLVWTVSLSFSTTGVTGVRGLWTAAFPFFSCGISRGLLSSPTSLDGAGVKGTAERAATRFSLCGVGVVAGALVKKPSRVVCFPADLGRGGFCFEEDMPGVASTGELVFAINECKDWW